MGNVGVRTHQYWMRWEGGMRESGSRVPGRGLRRQRPRARLGPRFCSGAPRPRLGRLHGSCKHRTGLSGLEMAKEKNLG